MLIDSHCHPNSEELRADAGPLMERARAAGVGRMLVVGCDLENSREALSMAHRFASYGAYAAVGVHPHEARHYEGGLPQELLDLASDSRAVALGEMGLDYHYDHSPRDVQQRVFAMQLEWAARVNMPAILHIREAMPDALSILRDFAGRVPLLFHCYAGGVEYLDEVLSLGALCALGGALTWKGKGGDALRDVAARIPIERLLLETDCPYMTPAPHRGKTNEPAYVSHVYEAAASVRGLPVEELSSQVQRNAEAFFKWGGAESSDALEGGLTHV